MVTHANNPPETLQPGSDVCDGSFRQIGLNTTPNVSVEFPDKGTWPSSDGSAVLIAFNPSTLSSR